MNKHVIHRIMIVSTTIVTSFFLGAAYQNSAVSVGGSTGTVTTTATLTIPEMVNITRSGFPIRVGNNEYKEQFVVRTNINWEVVIHNIPAGIRVLDKNGQWVTDSAVIAQGVPTNRTTVMVQYRRPENMVWGTESSITVRNIH